MAANSKSSLQETDAAPINRKHHVPPQEDSLMAKATTSSGECSLDGNVGRGQNENGEYNGGQLVPFKFSDEELESELDIHKLSLRRHRVSRKEGSNKIAHCEIEEINDGNLSLEVPKEELICASDEDGNNDVKSALVGVKSEMEITESNLRGEEELNEGNLSLEGADDELISGSGGEDANKEKSEVEIIGGDLEGVNNGNVLLENAEEELISGLDGEDANNEKSVLVGENLEVEITGNNTAGEELNNGKLLSEGAEKELHIRALEGEDPNNDQSAIADAKSEVDYTESASTTKKPSTEKGSILRVTPGKLEEGGTSDNPVSPSNKHQKQAQKNIHRSSDHVMSVDRLNTTELSDHSSELGGVLGKLSKSPTTRSSFAYDGSLSSHDGVDERVLKNAYTIADGRTRKGKGLANSLSYGDPETQHQLHMPNEKHHVMKESRRNQNKVLETTRHGNPHWMRTKRDEFPPRMPFHRSGSQSHYESGRPSNRMHDELYSSPSFLSHDPREDTDQEKMKLLRMIHKLQGQLNKTRYMSGETNGRLSTGVSYKGNHISAYHSHDLHEGRFSHAQNHPRCNGRCSHGWHQRHKYSRNPYSAEATSSAHHVDHSCFHCYPHVSADSPPRVLFQYEDSYGSYPRQDYCSSHRSYSSSPQWFTASKLPLYGNETKSDDQRHRAHEVRKYSREKLNLAKRHHRPVAGGAPFVTCHKCLQLLHLPADLLLYNKRACHKLKCGECSEVLKFSLKNGSHIVSFSPNAIGLPSSSELNDQNEVISSSLLPSTSLANYYQYSPSEPISYYEDYGPSVSQSYSSEGDPVFLTQFHPLHGSEYGNASASHGTFEPIAEKKIASRYSSTTKAPMETDESADFSSNMSGSRKVSAEMVVRPQPKSSSLLKLMGYSTLSQVIRGSSYSVEKIIRIKKESHNSQQN